MTANNKSEYYRLARAAVSKAELDLVTIDPDEDYIEVRCPECKRVHVFRFNELSSVRCEKCYQKHRAKEFYRRSEELVEAAGFSLRESNFEEDYIEVECPQCEGITSFHFDELGNIYCKDCAMEDAAFENDCDLYLGDESDGRDWEQKVERWNNKHDARPAVLVCRACGSVHIVNADAPDAIERIKKYECKCRGVTRQLQQLAADRGFSIEYKSSPYGYFSLKPGEIALLCNRCGDEVIFDLNDPELKSKIENLNCGCKTSGLDEDHLAWTKQGKIAWCADLLRVISLVNLTTFNGFSFDGSHRFHFPEEGDKEVYFAADPSDLDYAYAFVFYPNEKDVWLSKYLLFRFQIATWGTPQVDVEISGRWPYYYEKLYEAICQDINDGDNRVVKIAEQNFDCYISAYNALHNRHSSIWDVGRLLSALEGFSNALSKLIGNAPASKDQYLQRYIGLHTCPVCKKAYTSTEHKCLECGFPDLNRVFINRQEAEHWYERTVLPYKQRYNRKDSQ